MVSKVKNFHTSYANTRAMTLAPRTYLSRLAKKMHQFVKHYCTLHKQRQKQLHHVFVKLQLSRTQIDPGVIREEYLVFMSNTVTISYNSNVIANFKLKVIRQRQNEILTSQNQDAPTFHKYWA